MTLDQLQTQLDLLRSNLEKLDKIPQSSFEEFTSDFRNVDATLHLLQTSIQALIDIGSFIVASKALRTPRTSHEVFELLEEAAVLPAGTAGLASKIVGFRNRVVHLYDRVDEKRVFEILTGHRGDISELLDHLLAAIE